uniref:Ovule protein n=1 Tax=Anisakis simplex TaxID=6269 RepID=A0A0M3J8Y0_ANISI
LVSITTMCSLRRRNQHRISFLLTKMKNTIVVIWLVVEPVYWNVHPIHLSTSTMDSS